MFFTLEDYKKIYEWISKNSVKDTEFVEVTEELKEQDILTIVHNGTNMRVSLKDFVDLLFLVGVSDFLNITDKYKEKYISLSYAISLIPFKSRKLGQVITFLNEENKWRIYQYVGSNINLFNEASLWKDVIAEILGLNILPDEEDLTSTVESEVIKFKFKDKVYNPDDYSGLGRVYLRKNITDVVDIESGKVITTNLLTQDMINKLDTVYIILYDYNLNGSTITIPEGCVLDFLGGSFSNGFMLFNNTYISGLAIMNISIIDLSTIKNSEINIDWFGALKNNRNIDNGAIIESLKNISNISCVIIPSGTYYCKSFVVPPHITLKGCGRPSILRASSNGKSYSDGSNQMDDIFIIIQYSYTRIENLVVNGGSSDGFSNIGVGTYRDALYSSIKNCGFTGCNRGCIWMYTTISSIEIVGTIFWDGLSWADTNRYYHRNQTSIVFGTLTPIRNASYSNVEEGYDNLYVGVPVICLVSLNMIYMYYDCKGVSSGQLKGKHVAFAYSTNGITFTFKYPPNISHTVTNLDGELLSNTNLIFYDEILEFDVIRVPDSEYPFRMMANKLVETDTYTNKTRVYWFKSKDGINWDDGTLLIDAKLDSLPAMVLLGNYIRVYHRLRDSSSVRRRLIGDFIMDIDGNIIRSISTSLDEECYNACPVMITERKHLLFPTHYTDSDPTGDSLLCYEVNSDGDIRPNNSFINNMRTKIKDTYRGFTMIGNHNYSINTGKYATGMYAGMYMMVHTRNYYHDGTLVEGEVDKKSYICRIKYLYVYEGTECPATPIT